MNISHFATRNIKALLFLTVALCIAGGWVATTFPVSILPDVTFPRVKIIVDSGDRPVRTMEAAIARPIEEAIATVPGLNKIRTKIQRGGMEMSADFNWGADMITTQQLVGARVNEVRAQLPSETKITVERMNPTVFPVLGISLRASGLSPSELWSLATYTIKPRLSRVPGVARCEIQGGRVPEIAVDVQPSRLSLYKLSLPDVELAIQQANVVRAAGRFDDKFQQYELLVSGETTTADQLGDITVAQRNGIPISLKQIANVHISVQDNVTLVSADGKESVLLNIVRQPEANSMAVVDGVKKELDTLRPSLPKGAETSVFYDQSVLIGEAVGSVRDAVIIGAVLAVIMLMLFLADLRATIVTASIIPATVLITFLLMRLAGLTLNLMTLGALAIATGLVIDDAIVVVENVVRHLSRGASKLDAVRSAAGEIAAPMISSTLTTVVVFLPLSLLSGVAGAFFTALAVTLSIAMMVSLMLALLVSPSLCAAFLKVRGNHEEYGSLFRRLLKLYSAVLRFGIR
ncbi:MAG: efflux RND transporter permease subunit, partial [Chthonomonadales bacterium]